MRLRSTALLTLFAATALLFYPLRKHQITQMERDLTARRVGGSPDV